MPTLGRLRLEIQTRSLQRSPRPTNAQPMAPAAAPTVKATICASVAGSTLRPSMGDDVDRALRDAHERVLQPLRRYREQQEGRFRLEQDRDPLALAPASDDPTHIISR